MNQPILINTNTQASNKAANVHAAVNASQQEKTQAGQAFSNELDKHIDQSNSAQAKTNSSVNKSENQSDKAETKQAESANSVDKDGKKLPDDKITTEQTDESVVSEHVEQTESSDSSADAVIELSQSETASSDDATAPELDLETEAQPQTQEDVDADGVIPQGLIQTEAVHAVVHDIKQTVAGQKQADQQVQEKTVIGKLISDTVKNMTKPNNAEQVDGQTNVEQLAQAKAVTTSATTAEAETEAKTAKLRPDILQALSLRTNETKAQIKAPTLTPSEKTDAIIDKSVASLKTSGQVDIAELLERRSSNSASASNDKAVIDLKSPMATQNAATATIKTNGPVLDIQPTLQNAAWDRVMTSRVLWMAREGVQQASLKLNPVNLGPVEVRLNMHNDQANVTFIAQSAVTRDALEQAIPRLRESFAQNGLELTDADVSQQSFSQTGGDDQEQAELNSGTIQHNFAQGSDDNSDQEQKIVDNEQDVELGLSIYA